MNSENRFYEQDWRAAMERLEAHTALLKKLLAERQPGDSEERLKAEFEKLVELASAFPSKISESN